MIRLIELEGIRRVEELCWNPQNFEPPKRHDTVQLINAVSQSLFGITEYDTYHQGEDGQPEHDEWELQFEICDYELDEAGPVWTALGWDLTNGRGDELFCAEHFSRQIVAAARGLLPGARFYFLANERPTSDEEIAQAANRWGAALEAQARLFKRKR